MIKNYFLEQIRLLGMENRELKHELKQTRKKNKRFKGRCEESEERNEMLQMAIDNLFKEREELRERIMELENKVLKPPRSF